MSFPVEKKTCVHCGGPTTAPVSMPMVVTGTSATASAAPPISAEAARAPEPVSAWDPTADDFDGPAGLGDFDDAGAYDGPDAAHEAEVGTAPQSPMRALMNSLGGLVWIALVVLYSLAQSCGE